MTAAWDLIEFDLLRALQLPRTTREVTTLTALPPDTAKSQIEALRNRGLLISTIDRGVRFQLTLAGRRRLITLTATTSTPDAQAA
ncbi:hypothetical protein ACFY4C_20895 [Actinomadura viridis]|uniref:hypothetical protein n=1 Tax=Actinomadura viridis TaxID=58110 RepID=UPI00367BFC29